MLTLAFPLNMCCQRIRIWFTTPIPLAGAMTMMLPTVPNMVVSTPGLPQWIAWERGARIARAVAMVQHALLLIQYAAYAPRDGTCQQMLNLKLCSLQSADNQRLARSSSPRKAGAGSAIAMARTPIPSRRCLLATGATVGITTTRATTRTSGVLRRTVATARTTCAWTTTTAMRAWSTASSTAGSLFVVSRTRLPTAKPPPKRPAKPARFFILQAAICIKAADFFCRKSNSRKNFPA